MFHSPLIGLIEFELHYLVLDISELNVVELDRIGNLHILEDVTLYELSYLLVAFNSKRFPSYLAYKVFIIYGKVSAFRGELRRLLLLFLFFSILGLI